MNMRLNGIDPWALKGMRAAADVRKDGVIQAASEKTVNPLLNGDQNLATIYNIRNSISKGLSGAEQQNTGVDAFTPTSVGNPNGQMVAGCNPFYYNQNLGDNGNNNSGNGNSDLAPGHMMEVMLSLVMQLFTNMMGMFAQLMGADAPQATDNPQSGYEAALPAELPQEPDDAAGYIAVGEPTGTDEASKAIEISYEDAVQIAEAEAAQASKQSVLAQAYDETANLEQATTEEAVEVAVEQEPEAQA